LALTFFSHGRKVSTSSVLHKIYMLPPRDGPLERLPPPLNLQKQNAFPALAIRLQYFTASVEVLMLWTIFVMLLILWVLGIVSSYTLGGYIHLLLVVALVVFVVNLLTGRKPAL
jgi:hypothetical protein